MEIISLRGELDQEEILEENFEILPPTHPSFIHIDETTVLTPGVFNTIENAITRELVITGIELRWDGTDATLSALRRTRDVSKILVIADSVLISEALEWKGADVEIRARDLTFRRSGKISTVPESYATRAMRENRDEFGRPIDENGTLSAMDGRAGQKGGNITLSVGSLDLGDTGVRFDTSGAPGENGETGGLQDFPQITNGPLVKDVKSFALSDLNAAVKNTQNHHADLGKLSVWQTAHGDGEAGFKACWGKVPTGYTVTDMRLSFQYQQFLARHQSVVRKGDNDQFKSANPDIKDVTWSVVDSNSKIFAEMKKFDYPSRPANGENAFPSGVTGKGGDAGSVAVPSDMAPLLTGRFIGVGGASEASEPVEGGAAGTPKNYAMIALVAIQNTISQNGPVGVKANVLVMTGDTRPGKSAEGRAHGPGLDFHEPSEIGQSQWLDPRLLVAVSSYARRAYAAGKRDRAWKLLEPYWVQMQKDATVLRGPEVLAHRMSVENLVQNYRQNLDIYGNPPGWVPRFSVESLLDTYLADRNFSLRFIGMMNQAVSLMNSQEHAQAMLGAMADQTEQTIDQTRNDLFRSYEAYHAASQAIAEVDKTLKAAKITMNNLNIRADSLALTKAKEQSVVNAIFDVSAAVLDAIPVYQPGFSALATITRGVGEFTDDALYGDGDTNGWDVLEKIGGSVATALEDNADGFKDLFDDKLEKKYADKLNPEKDTLKREIDRLKVSIDEQKQVYDGKITDAYRASMSDDELRRMSENDAELLKELLSKANDRDALKKRLSKIDDRLDAAGDDPSMQFLVMTKEKLEATLSDAEDRIAAIEKERQKDYNANKGRLTSAKSHRDKYRGKLEKIEGLTPKLEKMEAEEKIKERKETFANIVDGAARMAKGAAQVGAAISKVSHPPKADSEQVQKLRKSIMNSELKEEFEAAETIVNAAREKMALAVTGLNQCNQSVTLLTAGFTNAIQTSVEISRNRMSLARTLDPDLKASFIAMQQHAEDRMEYYLYLFRRAFMYEFCKVPEESIANLNKVGRQIEDWISDGEAAATQLAEASGDDEAQALVRMDLLQKTKDVDMQTGADMVLKETLANLGQQILKSRLSKGARLTNPITFGVGAHACAELAQHSVAEVGETARLIPDLYKTDSSGQSYFLRNSNLKIAKIEIPPHTSDDTGMVFRKNPDAQSKTLRLLISFGRQMMLWDGKKYVCFRLADGEKPLEYGFNAETFHDLGNGLYSPVFCPDKREPVDKLFKTILKTSTNETSSGYSEIAPSFLSEMTLRFTLGSDLVGEIGNLNLKILAQAN